ncbi:MAG: hypothetical protein PHY29_03095 [Syntrophales bacterium]|nr:hypothetical protein [Syntrophales bacterium]
MAEKFQFYSEADRDPTTGKVRSEYPMWYNPRMISEKEEELDAKKAALANGAVPRGVESDFREGVIRLEEQLKTMKDTTLVDDAQNDRDEIGALVEKLGKILKNEYPTTKECERRVVDIQTENRKRFEPYLPISGDDDMVSFAKACQVSISPDGKITRDGMEKMWKIGRKYLKEYANVEILRR